MMTDRNLFNSDHGAGKGDVPRTKFDDNWAKRFAEIKWPATPPVGFVRKGNKLTKRYGSI